MYSDSLFFCLQTFTNTVLRRPALIPTDKSATLMFTFVAREHVTFHVTNPSATLINVGCWWYPVTFYIPLKFYIFPQCQTTVTLVRICCFAEKKWHFQTPVFQKTPLLFIISKTQNITCSKYSSIQYIGILFEFKEVIMYTFFFSGNFQKTTSLWALLQKSI